MATPDLDHNSKAGCGHPFDYQKIFLWPKKFYFTYYSFWQSHLCLCAILYLKTSEQYSSITTISFLSTFKNGHFFVRKRTIKLFRNSVSRILDDLIGMHLRMIESVQILAGPSARILCPDISVLIS